MTNSRKIHPIDQMSNRRDLGDLGLIPSSGAVKESLQDCSLENKIQGARKVIAIMAFIYQSEAPDAIKTALFEGLTDEDLPLSWSEECTYGDLQSHCRKKIFKSFADWDLEDVDQFLKKQWMVLEPPLKLGLSVPVDITLESKCALGMAFSSCTEVTHTLHSTVYKGTLRVGRQDGFDNNIKARNLGPVCVAVKKFDQRHIKDFNQERRVFHDIRSRGIKSDHLITHLGICDQAQCIIFPWADGGDLRDFWQRKVRKTPSDFLWSLRQLAGLAEALGVLHGVNTRHGDLKPANILYFSENRGGTLKIADLGIARGHDQATEFRRAGTITSATTKAYQGPEAEIATKEEARSRKYDCWSMGCMALEFVVWLLYDYMAIESFWYARDTETHAYYRMKNGNPQNSEPWEKAEVHPMVPVAVGCLRDDPRCSSTVFKDLVNLVDKNLLQIHSKDRLKAVDLHQELQAILQRAQNDNLFLEKVVGHRQPTPPIFNLPPPNGIVETTIQQKRLSGRL